MVCISAPRASQCHKYELGDPDPALLGTTPLALSAGFLCVIWVLSTFRKPLVTSSPRLSSAKTAATPPPAAGAGALAGGGGGATGGGGGGGGGGPPAAGATSAASVLY